MADKGQKGQSKWILIGSAIVVIGLLCSYFFIPQFQSFVDEMLDVMTSDDQQRIQEWVEQFGWKGPALIIGLMTAQMFLIVIPSWILMVMAVLAYGKFWGTVISVVAVLLASTIGYWLGVALGEHTISRLLGEKKEKKVRIEACRYGVWAVVIARLSPLFSNDAISFIAGLVRMGYIRFIIATFAGIFPLTLLIAAFGENSDSMKTGLIWISVISVLGLIAKIVYDKKIGDKKDDHCKEEVEEQMSGNADKKQKGA